MSRTFRAAMVVLAWVLAAGCGGDTGQSEGAIASAAPAEPPPVAAPAADPDSGVIHESAAFEAVLAPIRDVEVRARIEGDIVTVLAEEGDRVAAGAALARFDDRDRKALLEEHEAQVVRAESAWQRAQRLHADQVIAEEQFVAAKADWQIAKARRDQVAVELDRCTVVAPFSGVVSLRRVQAGQRVEENQPLFRVCDPSALRAELLVPEVYVGRLRAGHLARLVPVSGGAGTMARLTRVSPVIDPASGTFHAVIDVDNRRARLPAGVSVRVEFDPPLTAQTVR